MKGRSIVRQVLHTAKRWGGVFIVVNPNCLRHCGKLVWLTTALVEVEAVLNSRPLTYLSTDDLEEPLTPSHLLVGRRLLDMPDHICDKIQKNSKPRLTYSLKEQDTWSKQNTLLATVEERIFTRIARVSLISQRKVRC